MLLVSDVARHHICQKSICQPPLAFQCEHHRPLLNSQEATVCDRDGRCRTGRLIGYGIFSYQIPITQNVESSYLPRLGFNTESYHSFLNNKQSIRPTSLSVDCLSFSERDHRPARADSREKGL